MDPEFMLKDEARENPVNKLPLQVAAGEAPLQDRTVIMKVVRFDRSTTRSFGVLRRRLCYWAWCWWCSALGLSDLAAAGPTGLRFSVIVYSACDAENMPEELHNKLEHIGLHMTSSSLLFFLMRLRHRTFSTTSTHSRSSKPGSNSERKVPRRSRCPPR